MHPPATQQGPVPGAPFVAGAVVRHSSFGLGQVISVERRDERADIIHCRFRNRPGEEVPIIATYAGMVVLEA